ncbi:MAG: TetR/AcrR family transcriptional regulator [Bifidobacteriaceae bacterium]|jgi:AcrR family transcriptional regulator|nr:TetR/AcrR family transcriptional regulator [Bifidobacteriaceae bacterium]
MVNKQPEVTEQTRERLQQAFWELYLNNDVNKIRVKDITDRAGYNRATFYQYYRDIPELFAQAEDKLLDAIAELIVSHLGDVKKFAVPEGTRVQDVSLDDVVNSFDFEEDMKFLASTVQTYRSFMSVLLSERGDPKFVRKFKDLIVPLINQGADCLNLTDAEARLYREFALSGIVSAVSAWLSDDGGMSITDFVRFMTRTFPPKTCDGVGVGVVTGAGAKSLAHV